MKIRELIAHSGASRDTIRYYERMGLISAPKRLSNGYRDYAASTVQEIKFIRLAQSVGFTLKQIKPAVPHVSNPKPGCPILGEALRQQIALVDKKIEELKTTRKRLNKWLENNQAAI